MAGVGKAIRNVWELTHWVFNHADVLDAELSHETHADWEN
jgi:hypothetical protein